MQPPRTHKFLKLFLTLATRKYFRSSASRLLAFATLVTIFLISGFSQITFAGDVLPLNVDNDGDGYTENQGDCNDANKQTFPNAHQLLSFVDNNCIPNDGNNPDPEVDGVTFNFDKEAEFDFGDVNGDGLTDVIASTRLLSGYSAVLIYLGSTHKLTFGATVYQSDADITIEGTDFVIGSARVFDHNNDGKDDLFINTTYQGASILVINGRPSFSPGKYFKLKNSLMANNSKLIQSKLALIKNAGTFRISPKDIDGNDRSAGDLVAFHNGGYFIMSLIQSHLRGINDLANNFFTGFSYEDKTFESIVTGDFNNDGYGDVAVGENQTLGMEYGQAWVIYGAASWLQLEGDVVQVNFLNQHGIDNLYFYGNGAYYQAAEDMSAGDVDGDGLDDLLIGVTWEDANELDKAGCAWIIPGSGMDTQVSGSQLALNGEVNEIGALSFCGDEASMGLGASGVTLDSDLNGDGLKDINATVSYENLTLNGENLQAFAGQRLLRPDADQISISPDSTLNGTTYGGGDVDNDGTEDIIVTDEPNSPYGIHYLLFGGHSN